MFNVFRNRNRIEPLEQTPLGRFSALNNSLTVNEQYRPLDKRRALPQSMTHKLAGGRHIFDDIIPYSYEPNKEIVKEFKKQNEKFERKTYNKAGAKKLVPKIAVRHNLPAKIPAKNILSYL